MKKLTLYIIIVFVYINCFGQKSTTLNLQRIEFKDNKLTKTLFDIVLSNKDCFNTKEFYTLDFFQSSLSNEEYYLSINRFVADNKISKQLVYYIEISNITFFISNKVTFDIFKVLPSKKQYFFKIKNYPGAMIGGDYNFLIWRTLSGYYHVLIKICGE